MSTSYDDVPYPSHAFPATAPDRLAVLGALFGLATPAPATARVLELGSSSGGNVLPHAALHPHSEVLGLDLSARQVALGQRWIADLGLRNARIEQADLATWSPAPGAWDYVICHGVYSWVPEAVQRAILGICARALSPHGIAVVSWNANPGWHVQGMARDAMRYLSAAPGDVGDGEPLALRAARAQDALRVIAGAGSEASPHGRTIGLLAAQLDELLPDSYVAHEYLEAHNQPLYLAEFTRHAAAAGLRYLTDSHAAQGIAGLHGPEVAARLQGLAHSQIELEQYLDFLSCRPFRTSLLVRPDAPVRYDLGQASLDGLWLARPPRRRLVGRRPRWRPERPGGRWRSTSWGVWRALRAVLAQAWPGAVGWDEAASRAGRLAVGRTLAPHERAWLHQAVIASFLAGDTALHRDARPLAARAGPRPVAWAVSRHQAARDHLVVNLWHETLALEPVDLLLLRLCDGTRDRAALAAWLAEPLAGYGVALSMMAPDPATDPSDRAPGASDARAWLDARLVALSDRGFFVA